MIKSYHEFLAELIGKPWVANAKGPDAWDCYHLTQHVQKVLFDRDMPLLEIPNDPGWSYIIEQIAHHPERKNWREVPTPAGMPISAVDGSIVAMAASTRAAHIGTWFRSDNAILHTDNPDGVVFHDLSTVKAMGWQKLRFYEPLRA